MNILKINQEIRSKVVRTPTCEICGCIEPICDICLKHFGSEEIICLNYDENVHGHINCVKKYKKEISKK